MEKLNNSSLEAVPSYLTLVDDNIANDKMADEAAPPYLSSSDDKKAGLDRSPSDSEAPSLKDIQAEQDAVQIVYPTGFRMAAIVIALSLSIFLVGPP